MQAYGERSVEHRDKANWKVGFARRFAYAEGAAGKLYDHIYVADRAALAEATDLIAHYGEMARDEAANRADRSRALGNVVHFCRWRQIERLIDILSDDGITGSVH